MNNLLMIRTLSVISDPLYYVLAGILTLSVLGGIYLMSQVKTARLGNLISAIAMLIGIITTLIKNDILPIWFLYICLLIGSVLGIILAKVVKMIEMPQMIALLNGLGGLASLIVGGYAILGIGADQGLFSRISANVAMQVGSITFFGSLVAAGKLHRILPQKAITIPHHRLWTALTFSFVLATIVLSVFTQIPPLLILMIGVIVSTAFGLIFTIKIGGADMPITISLLNSLSGVAGAISGLAIGDVLLVSIGGIVGASGLLLTQIMCKAMNRKLFDILLGKSKPVSKEEKKISAVVKAEEPTEIKADPVSLMKAAKNVIIVPGYGMAIAQAQHLVKELADLLRKNGAKVRYAIHPVAGRMPGHMNVLLAEANVDYDDLFEMEAINDDFRQADLTFVIGANDVMNPAAREAEGTPIYGMPILNVDQCKTVFVFNYDLKPGYAGVENPLFHRTNGVHLFLGNAAVTLKDLLNRFKN